MPRALISLVFAISLSAMTIWLAVGVAVSRSADHSRFFSAAASPIVSMRAMSIL